MTSNLPAQAFGIGQRVRTKAGLDTFAVARIFLNYHGEMRYGAGFSSHSYSGDELVPAPERPPYVPSKRPDLAAQYDDAMRLAMETLTEVKGGE